MKDDRSLHSVSEAGPIDAQRAFDLYVEQMVGRSQELDELLVARLKWFSEDIAQTADRLGEDPAGAVALIKHLSSLMQELDNIAGASEQARMNVVHARRWALLIPETTEIHS